VNGNNTDTQFFILKLMDFQLGDLYDSHRDRIDVFVLAHTHMYDDEWQ
jgi:hypothetical protein